MTFEQMQALMGQILQAQAQAQVEMTEMRATIEANHQATQAEMAEMRATIEASRQATQAEMAEMRATIEASRQATQAEMAEMRATIEQQMTELRDGIAANREAIDLLLLAVDRLTQASTNFEKWKRENDLRFNTILHEIRVMNRRITSLEGR
jgi:uncharacterized membrane protein YqiK